MDRNKRVIELLGKLWSLQERGYIFNFEYESKKGYFQIDSANFSFVANQWEADERWDKLLNGLIAAEKRLMAKE